MPVHCCSSNYFFHFCKRKVLNSLLGLSKIPRHLFKRETCQLCDTFVMLKHDKEQKRTGLCHDLWVKAWLFTPPTDQGQIVWKHTQKKKILQFQAQVPLIASISEVKTGSEIQQLTHNLNHYSVNKHVRVLISIHQLYFYLVFVLNMLIRMVVYGRPLCPSPQMLTLNSMFL